MKLTDAITIACVFVPVAAIVVRTIRYGEGPLTAAAALWDLAVEAWTAPGVLRADGYAPPPPPPQPKRVGCDYCDSTRRAPSGKTCANCGAPLLPQRPIVIEPTILYR